jgi:8-oxo-dGTP pyrophosphatase MutT (NUDIX family)
MLTADAVRDYLVSHATAFDEERLFVEMALSLCERQPLDCCNRHLEEGHFTASAWLLNAEKNAALLIHHRGWDRWFQPGGHIEPIDADLEAAVRREILEECGIGSADLAGEGLFDLDIHPIPAKASVPAHWHYDLRLCFVLPAEASLVVQAEEIKAFQWVPLIQLVGSSTVQQSLRRMALKSK